MSLPPPPSSPQGFPPTPSVRPSRWWYLAPILVLLLIVAPSAFSFVSGVKGLTSGLIRVGVPGEETLSLEKGTYTVFYEYRSELDGQPVDTPFDYGGMDITVTSESGVSIQVPSTSRSFTYETPNHAGYSVAEFVVSDPGDYVISADYFAGVEGPPVVVLALGKDKVKSTLSTVFGAVGFFGGIFIALVLAAIVFFVRMANRRRMQRAGLGP